MHRVSIWLSIHFFLNVAWGALLLLFRKAGSLVFGADWDTLDGLLFIDFVLVELEDNDESDEVDVAVDAVLVGILEWVVACRTVVLAAVRPVLSLSNFKLAGMGDERSETLRRFGNGVTLGDNDDDFDALLFGDLLADTCNFFNCSILCVGLLTWSKDCRCRVMIFFSLYSATSALRVRCTMSLDSAVKRSSLTCAWDRRWRFRFSGVGVELGLGDTVLSPA